MKKAVIAAFGQRVINRFKSPRIIYNFAKVNYERATTPEAKQFYGKMKQWTRGYGMYKAIRQQQKVPRALWGLRFQK